MYTWAHTKKEGRRGVRERGRERGKREEREREYECVCVWCTMRGRLVWVGQVVEEGCNKEEREERGY